MAGKWKVASGELTLAATWFQLLERPCAVPITPTPTLALPSLQAGEISAVGDFLWEGGQPYLDTPSGRILLVIPADMKPPVAQPSTSSGTSSTPPAQSRLQVMAVGKWSIKSGQLVIAARYLQPWAVPVPEPVSIPRPTPLPPSPVPPPTTTGSATIYGRVRIGPLCPVEPCRDTSPDVYSSRQLLLQSGSGLAVSVKLNADGSFKAPLEPGSYEVNLSNCDFLGCKGVLPTKVTLAPNEARLLEIDIDTGIR